VVPSNGRENVRRAFEVCPEFAGITASILPNGSASANAASLVSARVDPRNQPGNGMLTRDVSWSVPLLSLPGRAGLDLGLALSYSSMVWTRSGPYMHFDEDNGYPSPGFRLGFPVVQRKVFDAQTAKNVFLLITPAGRRVELRQVGSSNIYEAADSSYLQLTDNTSSLTVRSTDGTQLSFAEINNEFSCTQVKDRNGNFITINHNSLGRISTITDTLGRVITFNYDGNANLISITQAWNGQPSHQWVSFGWGTRTMQSSFSDSTLRGVIGTANGTVLPVITQVNLNDSSHFTFDYTNSLQVSAIRNYFGTLERNANTFTYETPAGDATRLVDSRVSANNWTGINGVPAQVITTYSVAADGACVMTTPDGTVYREYYGSGWQRGLTIASEVRIANQQQKWTTTTWTQDNTSVGYEVNPRVTETNVYDAAGNRRRTTIEYGPNYVQYGLPSLVREYGTGDTVLREIQTDYNLSQSYLDRRIIGLVSKVQLSDGSSTHSKITYAYDQPSQLQATPTAATQHDSTYNTSFTARGNVTSVSRWDVTDINNQAKKLTTYTNYYNTGTPVSTTDPVGHHNSLTYADSFSDNVNRNTFAYPTTITDADGNSSTVQYSFDFGATTRTQSPTPAGQSYGAIQTMTYNTLGQLERVTTANNGAYTRYVYGGYYVQTFATVNNVADEAYSCRVFDGVGRVTGSSANHPGSTGGYRAQNTVYDLMGRTVKVSNPTEITGGWVAVGDDAAGWLYTQQTYDWQGRPLVTTNTDGTTKEASYAGCGCAGGTVVTLTDEGTLDTGVAKRRQQKIYSDVLGRTWKLELLNWDGNGPFGTAPGNSVYSTTVTTYNARDQVTQIRQYAGPAGSGTYQDTTLIYDGYGRIKTRHVPEQSENANTTWDYNADGAIQTITDARGASQNFTYNSRHLLTGISYSVPENSPIAVPAAATFIYDAAANRTSMQDGTGSTSYTYDSLSRMTSESRTFTSYSGTYTLNYSYNLANALTTLGIPFRSQQIGYNYDTAGRLSGVTASGFSATQYIWPNQYTQNLTSFASNITYRAWDARKSMTYGNTTSEQISYDARLRPATYTLNNMNYQNTNICCSYPTYSTMTWTYGYYNDGRLKHAWDSTNEWFDRAYKYDHVGRLKEASTFRRARGLSPYPAINYPDPYLQNITYDAFNHSSRTGKLYAGDPPSDIGTYVNNRRTNVGWEYDADGNNTRDEDYQQKFNAAGALIHSVSHAQVGDGIQYPLQPRLDITQTYDGNGAPAKRSQIARMSGIFDEFGNQSEPVEDVQTTYRVNSTVLGGATVVELESANTVHIYAGGQRIAREIWGNVTFEHHNPMTGSWMTSLGHSSYRTTAREERDPRGAEMPLSNPYGGPQSYLDWKFSQPLFIEGGDPFDYSSGREIDGLPVSEAEFQRRLANGSVVSETQIFGPPSQTQAPKLRQGHAPSPAPTFSWRRNPLLEVISTSSYIAEYLTVRPVVDNEGGGLLDSDIESIDVDPRPQESQVPIDINGIRSRLEQILRTEECGKFVKNLINKVSDSTGTPFKSDKVMDLFDLIAGPTEGGFGRAASRGLATDPSSGRSRIDLAATFSFDTTTAVGRLIVNDMDAQVTLHELLHFAGDYTDAQLAKYAASLLKRTDNPIRRADETDKQWIDRNSGYFDSRLRENCPNRGVNY
jgi:YD repeat-containing protein